MLPAYGRNGRNCEVALRRKIIPLLASASIISRDGKLPADLGICGHARRESDVERLDRQFA